MSLGGRLGVQVRIWNLKEVRWSIFDGAIFGGNENRRMRIGQEEV